MYAYIDARKWGEDGNPPLSEEHSYLVHWNGERSVFYGFLIMEADIEQAMTLARGEAMMRRDQLPLPVAPWQPPWP